MVVLRPLPRWKLTITRTATAELDEPDWAELLAFVHAIFEIGMDGLVRHSPLAATED